MKKTIFLALLSFSIYQNTNAQKGITLALQFNAQNIKYEGATPGKYAGTGFGIGVNLTKKLGPVQLCIDPRFMTYSHITNNNSKTQYIQIPVSINLLSFAKSFVDDEVNVGSVKTFKFGLNVGIYGAYAIGGKYVLNGTQKMKYGESATDNRSPIDFGLHTSLSFGSTVSSFRGYIQLQRGFKNIIPSARVNNDSRKLNSINVGVSFQIKKGKLFKK
jgi:hypothetical protein